MYKIIGADGKEYGPITAEQIRQWIAESRINRQTRVLPDGATEWKTLGEIPELAAALPIAPAPAILPQPGLAPAADQVKGPAIGLIVTAILNILVGLARIAGAIAGFSVNTLGPARGNAEFKQIIAMSGAIGAVMGGIGVICAILILMGAVKMRKLESHAFCVTAAVLAMIPCTSPCCLVGIPIGIWALMVLSKPDVKSVFH